MPLGDVQILTAGDVVNYGNSARTPRPTSGTFVISVELLCEQPNVLAPERLIVGLPYDYLPSSIYLHTICAGSGLARVACHLNRDRISF